LIFIILQFYFANHFQSKHRIHAPHTYATMKEVAQPTQPNVALCSCLTNYQGDHCEQCASGYVNYPTCFPVVFFFFSFYLLHLVFYFIIYSYILFSYTFLNHFTNSYCFPLPISHSSLLFPLTHVHSHLTHTHSNLLQDLCSMWTCNNGGYCTLNTSQLPHCFCTVN
jgi:Laminin EGF domain